jgi:hypothetical protein
MRRYTEVPGSPRDNHVLEVNLRDGEAKAGQASLTAAFVTNDTGQVSPALRRTRTRWRLSQGSLTGIRVLYLIDGFPQTLAAAMSKNLAVNGAKRTSQL